MATAAIQEIEQNQALARETNAAHAERILDAVGRRWRNHFQPAAAREPVRRRFQYERTRSAITAVFHPLSDACDGT
jgi:hypothetical protein